MTNVKRLSDISLDLDDQDLEDYLKDAGDVDVEQEFPIADVDDEVEGEGEDGEVDSNDEEEEDHGGVVVSCIEEEEGEREEIE